MGGNFLEFMKSMGIFILCAQSLMHFTAGKAYEKYVKLLIGIMILAQFTVQARALFLGMENAQIWEGIERFQRELEAVAQEAGASFGQGMGMSGPGAGTGNGGLEWKREGMDGAIGGTVIEPGVWEKERSALEAEIKERLEGVAASYGMAVEKVEIKEELPKIAVTVSRGTGEMGMDPAKEREALGEVKGGEMPMGEGMTVGGEMPAGDGMPAGEETLVGGGVPVGGKMPTGDGMPTGGEMPSEEETPVREGIFTDGQMAADEQMLAEENAEREKEAVGKIKIEKITIGGDKGQDAEGRQEDRTGELQGLAEAFSKALGTYADYIEVIDNSSATGYGALAGRAEVKYGRGKT